MKSLQVNFSKGINAVTDRRMVPEGFLTILDNVDLRSGSMRPFNLPEVYSSLSVPAGTTCIYEFLGNWFFSSRYRSYSAEVLPSQQRVYFCEEGAGHAIPQKVVNGIQAQLGTPIPVLSLTVSQSSSETPGNIVATPSSSGGDLPSGQYAYRISAVVDGGILTPSQEVVATIPNGGSGEIIYTGLVTLSWSVVQNATGYVIFGRIAGNEQIMARLGVTNTFTDVGATSPTGTFASSYDALNPLTYVYTYVRNVGGMIDESGPSPLSAAISPGTARIITRLALSDGFYSGAQTYTVTSTASSYTETLGGVLYKGTRIILTIGAQPDNKIWLANNMQLVFNGTDPGNGTAFSLEPFDYSYPTALVAPVLNSIAAPVGNSRGAFSAGAYDYAVAAVRGVTGSASSPIYNSVAVATTAASNTNAVTVSTTASQVTITWGGIADADGYLVYRRFGGTWSIVASLDGGGTSFTDLGTAGTVVAGLPTLNTTGVGGPAQSHVLVLPSTGVPPGIVPTDATPITLCRTDITSSHIPIAKNGDAIYGVGAVHPILNGVHGVTYPVTTLGTPNIFNTQSGASITVNASAKTFTLATGSWPLPSFSIGAVVAFETFANAGNNSSFVITNVSGAAITCSGATGLVNESKVVTATTGYFYLPVYTAANDSFTIYDVPNNNYITNWNIYRAGDSGSQFLLVASVPIAEGTYTDTTSVTGLGVTVPSSYLDSSGAIVTYAPPPSNMSAVELYNGMLFGIAGNQVRWTPTGQPDAWPGVYSTTFPFPPLALKAYGDGLIVFCPDKLYRLDGFDSAQISRHETKADGCIAPHSVQILNGSASGSYVQMMSGGILVYLAKRGLVRFNGMDSQGVTEHMLPYKLLIEPSNYTAGFSAPNFWWYPTPYTASYGEILIASGSTIPYQDGASPVLGEGVFSGQNKPLDDVLYDVRSFAWQNKYFLMFGSSESQNYLANATWCVDFGAPGDPVTTLGMKALDAHVSSTNEAFLLLPDMASASDNVVKVNLFMGAQTVFATGFTGGSASDHLNVYRFNPILGQAIPFRFRTAEITAGAPHVRKRWRDIIIHGDGTLQLRVFLDGALLTFATGNISETIDCTELPTHPRRVSLPPGSWGYSIALEGTSDKGVRMIELGYDPMPGLE